jgi:hypothetical protein
MRQNTRQHWIASAVHDEQLYIFESLQPSSSEQNGATDCGPFAIAYLTFLCHGLKPEDYRIQQSPPAFG